MLKIHVSPQFVTRWGKFLFSVGFQAEIQTEPRWKHQIRLFTKQKAAICAQLRPCSYLKYDQKQMNIKRHMIGRWSLVKYYFTGLVRKGWDHPWAIHFFFSTRSKFWFLDALASLDFKLSVSQGCFTASASTGLSDFFLVEFNLRVSDVSVQSYIGTLDFAFDLCWFLSEHLYGAGQHCLNPL